MKRELEKYRLQKFLKPLLDLGFEEIDDLEYLDEQGLGKLDLKYVEQRKFEKMIRELGF